MNRTDCINHLRAGHAMTARVSRIIADMLAMDKADSQLLLNLLDMARKDRDALRNRIDALEWLREVEQSGGAWLAKRYRKIGRKRYDSLVTQYRATHAHALEEAGYDLYE